MLPTNFDTLIADRPDLGPILEDVASWIKHHPDWDIIDPRELSRSLTHADAWALATALRLLCDRGFFRQVYMVVTPSGVLADGKYDDPRRIPLDSQTDGTTILRPQRLTWWQFWKSANDRGVGATRWGRRTSK